jgi:hypothetical protein
MAIAAAQLFDDAVMRNRLPDERVEVSHCAVILGCGQNASQRNGSDCGSTPFFIFVRRVAPFDVANPPLDQFINSARLEARSSDDQLTTTSKKSAVVLEVGW